LEDAKKCEVGLDIKCISNDYWIIDSNQTLMQYKMKNNNVIVHVT
jgi:hypothetical protein